MDLGSILTGKAGLKKTTTRATKTELDQFQKPALVEELEQRVAQKSKRNQEIKEAVSKSLDGIVKT